MSLMSLIPLLLLAMVSGAALFFVHRSGQQRAQLLSEENQQLKSQLAQFSEQSQALQQQLTQSQTHLEHLQAQTAQFKDTIETQEQSLGALREEWQSLNGKHQSALATLKAAEQEKLRLSEKEQQLEVLQTQLADTQTQLKQVEVSREKDQQNWEEKLKLLNDSKEQLSQSFENISNKIFEEKSKQFKQTSQEGLSSLLNPFKDQLEGLRKKVDDVYVSESKDRAALKAQIGELHNLNKQITEEASALTRALKGDKKAQGNWGELVLETVLEKSGLRKDEEYVREQSITSEDGDRYRPDVIINLPEGKHIIIDAKVSLIAYTEYVNAESEHDRQVALKTHVEAIRLHIKRLADKAYAKLPGVNSPDFVFLFMPVEPAFMTAFQYDDQLFNDAFEQRIVVVTPTTLLASLRTVSNLWSIERQNRHAKQLAEQAAKVHDKLVGFVETMEKVGMQLGTVQKTYDTAWNQLKEGRGNLISQAHKFKDLGVRTKKELPKQIVETAELEFNED